MQNSTSPKFSFEMVRLSLRLRRSGSLHEVGVKGNERMKEQVMGIDLIVIFANCSIDLLLVACICP